MPLVIISRKSDRFPGDSLSILSKQLTYVVAKALSIPGSDAALTQKDIEVWHRNADPHDVAGPHGDLQILIFAHDYTDRRVNLDERQEAISSWLTKNLPRGIKGFVWIVLAPTSFGAFVSGT